MTILEDFRDLYLGQQHMYKLVVISIKLNPLFLHMFVYLNIPLSLTCPINFPFDSPA